MTPPGASPVSGVPGAFDRCEAELGIPGNGVAGTERAMGSDPKPSPRLSGEPRRDESPGVRPCETCCNSGVAEPDILPLTDISAVAGERLIVGFVTVRRSPRP